MIEVEIMNLKEKLMEDHPQLSEMKIEQIIEEWIRQLIREEVEKYFERQVPDFD